MSGLLFRAERFTVQNDADDDLVLFGRSVLDRINQLAERADAGGRKINFNIADCDLHGCSFPGDTTPYGRGGYRFCAKQGKRP